MKRLDFLKNLLAIPLVGGELLKTVKSNTIVSKEISLDSLKQGGVSILNDKPTLPQEGTMYFKENKGMYVYMQGNWWLLVNRDCKESDYEPKLSLSDRRV